MINYENHEKNRLGNYGDHEKKRLGKSPKSIKINIK